MPTLQLDNTYYSLTHKMYAWMHVNAPDTAWDQTFGTTTLIFTTEEKMEQFKEWLGKP
jgi:hypothetical protein